MRAIAAFLLVVTSLTSGAQGQVSVDMRALDSLGPARAPAPRAPAPRPPVAAVAPAQTPDLASGATRPAAPAAERRVARPSAPPAATAPVAPAAPAPAASASSAPVASAPSAPVAAASPRGVPPRAGAAPPPVAAAPIPVLPTAQPAPPPPSTTVAAPAPEPLPFPPTVRLLFDNGNAELSPADEARIRDLARAIPAPASSSVNVVAYAAGKPDDPSTARRLSLSRGLAVRAVLLETGIPSSQIYVRAMGSSGEPKVASEPANRVELTVARIGTVTR